MSDKWQPKNYQGTIHYDPRRELLARARRAQADGDTYVAVPLTLALACADLRECTASMISHGDEDGPMSPLRIFCRLPEDHERHGLTRHHNGYASWADAAREVGGDRG